MEGKCSGTKARVLFSELGVNPKNARCKTAQGFYPVNSTNQTPMTKLEKELQSDLETLNAQIKEHSKLYAPATYDKLTEEEKLAIGQQESAQGLLREALEARIAAIPKK